MGWIPNGRLANHSFTKLRDIRGLIGGLCALAILPDGDCSVGLPMHDLQSRRQPEWNS